MCPTKPEGPFRLSQIGSVKSEAAIQDSLGVALGIGIISASSAESEVTITCQCEVLCGNTLKRTFSSLTFFGRYSVVKNKHLPSHGV